MQIAGFIKPDRCQAYYINALFGKLIPVKIYYKKSASLTGLALLQFSETNVLLNYYFPGKYSLAILVKQFNKINTLQGRYRQLH